MTTIVTTYADLATFPADELFTLTFGDGTPVHANAYVQAIGAIEGHDAWTWACGADLAAWGAFRRREDISRDTIWTLMESERSTGYGSGSDPVLAQRFDY
ncbi:hypothetical protein SEA_SHAGRAT_40 [Rhodococcus phage Shagrat]|nr:hypothetical protein SEA_SHAGRAT_40 [Rhodococcus phage Shagrat]